MYDTSLYSKLLNLEHPWFVEKVELKLEDRTVEICLKHLKDIKWPCPICGKEFSCYDHTPERSWRHLDTCQCKTIIYACPPRIKCPEHGVKQVNLPWAESHSRLTILMERLAIDILNECITISGAQKLLGMSWDEIFGVMKRAVARGQIRKTNIPLSHVCIDEKAFKKGHSYMTLVYNIKKRCVEFAGKDRKTISLEEFYKTLSQEQLNSIEAVCMDMWDPFFAATVLHVPDALSKIVYDRFHVMKYVNKAVDKVRKAENRELREKGQPSQLAGTKYLWLYGEENVPDKRKEEFERLKNSDLKVAKAWAMKENIRNFWTMPTAEAARGYISKWFDWVKKSKISPMKKAAETIMSHLANILTYFEHHITNGIAEGLNSKIASIKRRACGYRNHDHFKTAIYFFCGGLDLYPRVGNLLTHKKV
jgi:transposase